MFAKKSVYIRGDLMELNLKKYFLLLLASSIMGSSLPAPRITPRKQNRMGRSSKIQSKKPESVKKNNNFSIKTQSLTALENIKKFITLDYLLHCDCPKHQKNQTIKNQIRRHPERAAACLTAGLAAGALSLWGIYRFLSFNATTGDNVPSTPPTIPLPEEPESINPENPQVNIEPFEIEMVDLEVPQEPEIEVIQIHQQAPQLVPEEVIDQNTYDFIIPAFNPHVPVMELQTINVPESCNLEHSTPTSHQTPCIQLPPTVLGKAQKTQEIIGTPFNDNNAPISNNSLEQDWIELNNSYIEADKTPGFGELITRENWNKLYELGQIASGKLAPLVTFMQKNMTIVSKRELEKIQKLFDNVIHKIEKHHVPSSTPLDPNNIKKLFTQFQETTIKLTRWNIAANSFDSKEITTFKALFWLMAEHQLEMNHKQSNDPKVKNVLLQLMRLAREMAQEVLVPQVNEPATVAIRPFGSISTQEHDWKEKRIPCVLVAQKKILDPYFKERFKDEIITPLNIGICLSGGGYRAMTFSAGCLTAFEKLRLVDSALYVSGLSGSTWFLMRWLLSNPSVSTCKDDLKKVIPRANLLHLFANKEKLDMERLVQDVIIPKVAFRKPISSIDLYGGLLARALLTDCAGNERHQKTMCDIAKRIDSAQYPFPICTAISETNLGTNKEKWYNWFEFNPFEVENDTIGLCIPAHAYGNKFQHGKTPLLSQPESLGSIMATCGSAYTINFANQIDQAKINGIKAYAANTAVKLALPEGLYKDGRISPAQVPNPWYQLDEKRIQERFESNIHAHEITEPELCTFADAGIDFNLPLIPLLKRARDLDVILVCDASGSSNIKQEKTMPDGKTACPKELAKFFQNVERYGILYERKKMKTDSLSFSVYVPQDYKNKRDPVWIEGEKLPIIIYFNFITDPKMIERGMQNQELKKLIEENNLAEFDAQTCLKNYGHTFNFEYSSDNFKQLAGVGELNILLHKEEIFKILGDAFRRTKELKNK